MKSEDAILAHKLTPEELRQMFPHGGFVGFIIESGVSLDYFRVPVMNPMRWRINSPFEGNLFAGVYPTPLAFEEPLLFFYVGNVTFGQEIKMGDTDV